MLRAVQDAWYGVFGLAKNYVVLVKVRDETSGLEALQHLTRVGPLLWPGLLALVLTLLATAYLSLNRGTVPLVGAELWEGEPVAVPLAALYLSLLVVALGWGYLLAGAARAGLLFYVVAAAYVAYYGLYAGLSLGGTPWFMLVPLALLALGGYTASVHPSRWRLPLLLVLSLLVGLLLYPSLHISRWLPGVGGRLLVGALAFGLVANPWALRTRTFRPALAWSLATVCLLGFYGAAMVTTPRAELLSNTFLSFNGLMGLVSLFWYWLGLDLVNGAQDVLEWMQVSLRSWRSQRLASIGLWLLWGLWFAVAYLLVHGLPLPWVRSLSLAPLGRAALSGLYAAQPSNELFYTLNESLYLVGGLAVLAILLGLARRLSYERLATLFGLSVAGFVLLLGFNSLFMSSGASMEDAGPGFWAHLIFVVGIFWEVLKVGSDLSSGELHRPLLFASFLLLFGGISLLQLSADYRLFQQELTLNAFVGILYLGVPYALYLWWGQRRQRTPVRASTLGALLVVGLLSAIPCLVTGLLFLAPLVWLLALWVLIWRGGQWDEPLDGVAYALALATGFVTYYAHPVLLPIPSFLGLMGAFLDAQIAYTGRVLWPWQASWWWITLGAAGAGVLLGLLLGWVRRAQHPLARAAWSLLALALAMLVLSASSLGAAVG